PIAGRPFRDDEDRTGQEPAVIVSHRFWMQHLGGGGLDRNVSINSVPVHVVGVAPAGFFGFQAGQWTDVYAPLAARVAFRAQPGPAPRGEDDTDWWVRQIARLKPGSTAAFAQFAGLFRNLAAAPNGKSVPEPVLEPGRRGLNALG